MYKTSDDRRFQKNKMALRRAFLDLVVEHGYQGLTVSDITRRADLNRMTFYGHYETIEDIFQEFVDDMEREISQQIAQEPTFDVDGLFAILNTLMYREIDFFRHVANTPVGPDFKTAFKNTIARLLRVDADATICKRNTVRESEQHGTNANETKDRGPASQQMTERQQLIICDQVAVCIAYSYLDWLSGDYGDAPLDEVIELTKELFKDHLPWISYR